MEQKEIFSIHGRVKSFAHAMRGLGLFFTTARNAWIQTAILLGVIALGLYFNISYIDWMFIVLASGFVLAAEAFNTAIEIDINLTSPEYHPYARDTKDVAAGAVLISAIVAAIIGICIFWPYISDILM